MKYFDLNKEEQEMLRGFEAGEFVSVKNLAKIKKDLKRAAVFTLSKTRNINLRLSEKTVLKLKSLAITEGIPYQTLAASVLHKYTNSV